MKPVQTKYSNVIFTLPGGTEDSNLPVEKTTDSNDRPILISTWELTDTELLALQETKKIDLIVWGTGHPPVAIAIHDETH